MASYLGRTYLDYSNEKSNARIRVDDIDAASITANLIAMAALNAAMDNLTLGTPHKLMVFQADDIISNVLPADVNAQRERKWIVTYRDTVTEALYTFEIPTADLTGNVLPNSDVADLASADWVAFIAAFEAIAVSPVGNTVTVVSARHVGRKL